MKGAGEIYPAEIVKFIDTRFPAAQRAHVDQTRFLQVSALVDLLDRMPQRLIELPPGMLAEYVEALSTLRRMVALWATGAHGGLPNNADENAVHVVQRIFSSLSDHAPVPHTGDLQPSPHGRFAAGRQEPTPKAHPEEGDVVEPDPKKVFIIHGQNQVAADEMAKFVFSLGLEPLKFGEIRSRMGGANTNIVDVVIQGMSEAAHVIALFTADEVSELRPELAQGKKAEDHHRWQARPNVIFEAGIAYGRNPERVIFVKLGEVSLFTDASHVHYYKPTNDPKGHRKDLKRWLAHRCPVNDSDQWMTHGDFESCVLPEVSTRSPFDRQAGHQATAAHVAADLATVAAFEAIFGSEWMANFYDWQLANPQYVGKDDINRLSTYQFESAKPERSYYQSDLAEAHDAFLVSVNKYMAVSARERIPDERNSDKFVISTKAREDFIDNYDERYDRQVRLITDAVEAMWEAWGTYVRLATLLRAAHRGSSGGILSDPR